MRTWTIAHNRSRHKTNSIFEFDHKTIAFRDDPLTTAAQVEHESMTQCQSEHFNAETWRNPRLTTPKKLYSWLTSRHYVEARHETRFEAQKKIDLNDFHT